MAEKKKRWDDGPSLLTLADICRSVDGLNLEDNMEINPAVQRRRDNLKRDVKRVLSSRPDGLHINDLWNTVMSETGHVVKKKGHGVSRLPQLLEYWTDEIRVSNKIVYLRKPTASAGTFNYNADFPSMFEAEQQSDRGNAGSRRGSGAVSNESEGCDVDTNKGVHLSKLGAQNAERTEKGMSKETQLSEQEIRELREEIVNKLKHYPDGIKHTNLYGKLECHFLILERMLCQWHSFADFLREKMSDVVTINKRNIVRICSEGQNKKDEAQDQTTISTLSALSAWGAPARPSISQQNISKLANQKTQGGKETTIPSLEFISISDDDEEDKDRRKQKPSSVDTVDLTVDNPQKSNLDKNQSFVGMGPFPTSAQNRFIVPQQQHLLFQSLRGIGTSQPQPLIQFQLNPALMMNPLMRGSVPNQPGPSGIPSVSVPLLNTPPLNNHNDNLGPRNQNDIVDLTIKQIDRKEFETKQIVVHPVNIPRNRQPPRDFVDTIAKECIETLAEANEYALPERVDKLVCQRFQIQNVRQIGFNHVTQIPCVNELNRLLNKIHAYVLGFIKTRSICTLHELKESLREYVPNKEDFSKLKVGPLQRSPVVYEQFKFPPDQAEIPEITSFDVLEHFRNFLTKKNLWTARLTLEPFMDYLVEQYNAENAYFLGVRIMSLPLAAAILKKAQRDAAGNRREVFEQFKNQLQGEIEDAFRKFRASILQTGEDDGMEVRSHYLKMRPDLVVMEIFEKFNLLMTVTRVGEMTRSHEKRLAKVINEFVSTMKNDGIGRSLFHLAICMSSMAIEEATMAILMPATNETETSSAGQENIELKPPPRKDYLIDSMKTYIERCMNAGSLSLNHLDRIEEKLLEDFGFQDFRLMGYGRFLQFVITENKIKQVLEEGGGLLLGSSTADEKDGTFKPHQTDLLEFIKQCKMCGWTQPEEIENALCRHYGVKEVRHLGYGNITRLLSHAEKHRVVTYSDFIVYYQSTLTKPSSSLQGSSQKVGVLGHQTKDLAKTCLHNCPLLEDLAEWSQWSLVFEPELGKLKDFVQRYGGVTSKPLEGGRLATIDFLALETKPGVLVKIVSNTSAELVAEALERRDIYSFCGHLVSMVIAYKGVSNIPKALLGGHIKTALLQLHAADPRGDTPDLDYEKLLAGAPSTFISQNSACQFVLQCLLRIPTKICVDLADDLLLSPLGQVVGSTKFKQILVQLCNSVEELNHLIELGCLLGIQEWTNLIAQKCILPETSIQKVSPDVEELFKEEQQEQDEDEDDSSGESEDEDLEEILAGDTKIEPKAGSSQESVSAKDGNVKAEITDVDKVMDDDDETMELGKKDTRDDADNDDVDDDEVEIVGESKTVEGDKDDAIIIEDGSDEVKVTEVKVRTCEDIINEIRKEEFGVGVKLSEDGQRLMKVQQQRLGRSLDRLSKDLYSKDTHFVLELIQNADDNSYDDRLLCNADDLCPSVKFVIDEESVCVRNNELGFKERDIRALCDVGRSTKGKHKFGYIGQKGIGFKSVFRVTDTPEIHSNGFHMKFDVNSGPMGYILPHWSKLTDRVDDRWTTNIILSLKPDMRLHTRTLAARFNDIHPSLLLFLHRLREITIENKVENKVQTMRRRDVGENIIEIQHSDGLDRWLVIKKMLDASKISSQAKSGADVESTEIALAFPVKPATQMSNMQGLPPKQLVFAFLPLRSYGFRFIVQGDFDVPSSREDVDRDSSWNQWLRNEIHTLFLDSLDMFKSHQEFSNVEAVISYLQFVPMEDEVLDFFKPVASDILKKLKARPCVPTQPNSEGVISWKIPSQTVRVRDPLVRSVITADLLQKHLNLHYLHPDVASMLNPTLTSCLGIETLTSEHLFHLGKALIVKMEEYAKPEDVLLIARWLACIYRSLDEFQDDDSILSTLKSLQMLPLSDGKLVSLQADTVFYPIPNLDESSKGGRDPLYYLQQDVNSLHPLLLKTDDDEVNSQVHKLLLRLGIKQLSPFDVINHHVIPVLKSEAWKNKSKATIISYIIYVKEQTEKQNNVCNMDEIKDIAQVITNKGIRNPNKEPVHFSHHYGNTLDLQKTFPGYEWTVVDPIYLPPQPSHLTLVSWHDFFLKLGVEDYFSVQKREVRLKREELETSIWKNEVGFWPQGETEYVIQDYYSEELETLITNNKYTTGEQFQGQMRALCLCFEKMWDSKFSRYTKTNCCDTNGRILKETNTSFSILLQTSCWLPALQCFCYGEPDGNVRMSKIIEMKEPAAIFIHSDRLEKLLSNKVLYLDVRLSLNSTFHQFLGLKNSINIETVKEYLLQWCARSEDNVPAVFSTSLSHMKQVYSYLSQELNIGNLQNLLRDHPIYFVPLRPCGPDDLVAGQMLNRKEIWLADRTGLFDKYRGLLEEFHSEICKKRTLISFYGNTPDLLKIFRQEGKIDQQPQVEEYMELLSLLCTTSLPKDVAVFSDVLYIFTMIGQALAHPPEAPNEETANMMQNAMKEKVKKKIQKEKVLPTKKGLWVSLNDKPMIADNRDWEKMFADKDKVHFLDLEDKQGHSKHRQARHGRSKTRGPESSIQPEMIDVFIEVCEVKSLSNCVAMEVTPGLLQPCFKIQQYFHDIVPIMQQYLSAKFEESYKELEHQNTKQMFTDAKFYQTGKLEVIYRLNITGNETFEVREEKCVISPPNFYFHCDHVNSIAEVNREIARHFSGGNSACNTALRGFLLELHTTQTTQDGSDSVEMLLQRHEADGEEIPENEVWEVEPPALPELEPEPIEEFPEVDLSRKKKSSNKDEPFELRVWPPVASEDRNKPKEKSEVPTSNIWPPPQAKDYMRSLKELPPNIRMAAPDDGKSEPSEENTENRPRSSEPQPTGRSTVVTAHPGPSGDGQGQGQPGNLGYSNVNQENVLTIGSASDIPRKRKLSDEKGVEDAQSVKRHSSEQKLTIDSIEMSENGQIVNPEQSHEHREKRDREKNDEGQRETTHDSSSVPKYSSPDGHARSPHRQTQSPEKGRSNIIGDPVWTRMASEYTYDELGSGAELSTVLTLLDSDGNPEIGRWGENLVACYLQRQKEAGNIIDFEWSNHQNETGAPYDFLVHFADDEGIHEDYIEVKSTVSDDKEVFEISVQQIKFAEEKKGNFHIYRVFNAGNPEKVRLIRIFDLDLRLSQKQVRLCMLI